MKSQSMRRQALVVLGMHRSGTSALTRVLNLAGAFLPEKLMPPVPGNNERGFWEPVDLVAVDERALAAAGVPWDSPRRIDPAWFDGDAAEHSVSELARFFERNFAQQPLFVIKDPRLCRVVPLLRRALERSRIDAAFVLSLRHPSAVAGSLEARDGMPRDHGRALWLRYMLDAERWTRGAPRVAVGFEEVISDWAGVLAKISAQLGVHLADGPELGSAVAEFLEPQLVHHRDRDHEPRLPQIIARAWLAMKQLQAGRDTKQVRNQLDRVWNALDAADEVLGAAFSWATKLRQPMAHRRKTAERELEKQRAALQDREELVKALRSQLQKQQAALQDRDELAKNLRSQLEATRAELASHRLQLQKQQAALKDRDESAKHLRSQLEATRAELASHRLQSQKKREELERGAKQLDERIGFLQSMAQAAIERARTGLP